MDIFKSFGTDAKLEEEGAWVSLGGNAKILVGRAGNKKYSRLLAAQVEKNQAVLDLKTDASDNLSDEIMIDVFAQSILLGFEALTFKGEAIEYSVDNAKILLAVKDFRTEVGKHARNVDNFRNAAEAVTAKK